MSTTTSLKEARTPLIVVTGANRGIGLATSLVLARTGYEVIATVRSPERASAIRGAVAAENLPISILTMDVDSDVSVRDAIAEVIGSRGAPYALVNNAGIERHGSVEEVPLSEFRAVMETNYFGALRCVKAVLPAMRERGSGCIVNVSSVAGRIVSAPLTPYAVSKHALEALTEGLAQEMKPFGIRVALVEPGIIDTDMARDISDRESSIYPHARRVAAIFALALSAPTEPEVVAEKIREIIAGGSWKLRHPVGPDAEGRIASRRAMSDEDWIDRNAMSDEDWIEAMKKNTGVDLRPWLDRSDGVS